MRSLVLSALGLLLANSASAEFHLAQIHIRNTGYYEITREPVHSCQRSNAQLRSIRIVSEGDLKANMAVAHFADGSSQNATFYKDTFGGGETVAEIYFDRPRCVESVSLQARSKTHHGGTMVSIYGEEAFERGGRPGEYRPNRPGRPHWRPDTRPPYDPGYQPPHNPGYQPPHNPGYQPPYNPPAPIQKRAVQVVFASQKGCGGVKFTVLVRHNDQEQQQLCSAVGGQAGGRLMRTALVSFNDGSSSCENITDGDLSSVCIGFMRTVR